MLGYKVCGECGLPITGGYSIGSLGAVHKSRVDCIRLLRAENERLREVERKAVEQSEYIQRHGLTEIEVAGLRAENERLRSWLQVIERDAPVGSPASLAAASALHTEREPRRA